jgi:hypothetical protein
LQIGEYRRIIDLKSSLAGETMRKTEHGQQCPDIHIAVENFEPIEKAEIDLRPLTVFVGEGNTGKAYLSARS